MNWAEVKLGDLIEIISGVSYTKDQLCENGKRIIRGGNIINGEMVLQDDDVFVKETCCDSRNSLRAGDTIIVASTGSRNAIGKAASIRVADNDIHIGAFLRILRPFSEEISSYISYFFKTNDYKSQIENLAKGSNINNVKSSYILNMCIGIPPLEEQHRIVERIEELYVVLDEIEASLQS